MLKRLCTIVAMLAISFFVLQIVLPSDTFAGGDDQAKLLAKIKELEDKKAKLHADEMKATDASKPSSKNLQEVIGRYEKLLQGCSTKKSARCADVIYTLGGLYYEEGRDGYIQAREDYENKMNEYQKHPSGPEPVNPIPNYSKPLSMYEELSKEYPDFPKLSEAYYQMGTIYLLMGDLDKTKDAFTQLVEKFPNSPRASGAYFRLSDLCYLDHDNTCALKNLEMVKDEDVDPQTREMVNYRKGEMYYNLGEFDKAINLFYTYVEKCDAGQYPKQEFRDMALEFMGVAFSDMGNGGNEAINFFKKVGHKPYEAYVMYTIGLKNRTHGQFDDAIVSLQLALNQFPFYKDAPTARQMLIECYVVKKEYEKANDEREKLVDDYGPNSEWYSKNSTEKAVIDQSHIEVGKALGQIAVYYHALAQKKKDKALYEKALARYNEFFAKFPDDKWHVYEYKYNVAEIYSQLGDCDKAADNYNFVAMQDLAAYPAYKTDIDTMGMDQEAVEKKKQGNETSPLVISQEDAGYNVVVTLSNCRTKAMAADNMNDEQAYNLPETKKLLDYVEQFQARFPKSSNAAEVMYLAGNIHFGAKSWDNAIRVFKQIADTYPGTKIGDKAVRMLANTYVESGQYDLAMGLYRQLLTKLDKSSTDYLEVLDLAAGALFKRAEATRKSGDLTGAADMYKSIRAQFPESKIADQGWFQAGVCYDSAKSFDAAAATFQELPAKFPKSTLREEAFMKAADIYKQQNNFEKAAQVYQDAANAITKAEFAIPSLSQASECYQKLNQFDMAGKMYEMIYQRYATDPKTPQSLYNAGLIFEKGKFYDNAINVYNILSTKFPESEYASEAVFSIGLCYEKMGRNEDMAKVFADYAVKYANDRYKQVQAFVKAGDAYYNMKNDAEAEKNYLLAVSVYEKFHDKNDIDVETIAQSYFKLGEVYYHRFEGISLNARNEREMKDLISKKTKALEDPAKYYAKAIELGVEEWTLRGTFMIGKGFVDMAAAVADQTLFGSTEQKIASRIKILSSLEKYYEKAQEYFYKNIDWAHNQNIQGEYVNKSIDEFMHMAYLKGDLLEQVGNTFASAPVPKGLSAEEVKAYQDLLKEKQLEAQDAAEPKYEEGIKAAQQLGIAQSQWIDKMKERIKEIKPDSKVLDVQITPWQPKPEEQKVAVAAGSGAKSSNSISEVSSKPSGSGSSDFDRAVRRINNIMNMQIAATDKILQLNRIEMDAKRNATLEEERIKELKDQLGR